MIPSAFPRSPGGKTDVSMAIEVLKIIELDLTDAEKQAFKKSVASVQKTADEVLAMTR